MTAIEFLMNKVDY